MMIPKSYLVLASSNSSYGEKHTKGRLGRQLFVLCDQ